MSKKSILSAIFSSCLCILLITSTFHVYPESLEVEEVQTFSKHAQTASIKDGESLFSNVNALGAQVANKVSSDYIPSKNTKTLRGETKSVAPSARIDCICTSGSGSCFLVQNKRGSYCVSNGCTNCQMVILE